MPAQVETPADLGDQETSGGIAARWISELDLSEKYQKDYLKRCKIILDRFCDKRAETTATASRKFSTLWSNIETLKPACYAKVPQAIVTRRFKDADPIGRVASEILERAIEASLDCYDFDQVLKGVRDDFLLFGRGVPWVRYEADFEAVSAESVSDRAEDDEEEAGEYGAERVSAERVPIDHVAHADFGTNAARTWFEVRFVWRRSYMPRKALIKRFGKKIGQRVPLDWRAPGERSDDSPAEQFDKAMVYEIWDKDSRKVFWISKGHPDAPLDVKDDPLGLKDFFPCPKPAYGTLGGHEVIPVPDYVYYQDQAEEVDELTARIGALTDRKSVV